MVKMIGKKKKRSKGITSKAKKKRAVARAIIKKGKGIVKTNKRNLETMKPDYLNEFIRDPLELARPLSEKVNISVNVKGGGSESQIEASRLSIARALVEKTKDDKLKKAFTDYDKNLLVADTRRKETYKPGDSKARKKRQKSFR